jgi:hypothetical protein
MKISVRSQGKRVFALLLPNCMVFNTLTSAIVPSAINKYCISHEKPVIDAQAARRLIRAFGKIRKKYGRFTLMDVVSANGDIVKIEI